MFEIEVLAGLDPSGDCEGRRCSGFSLAGGGFPLLCHILSLYASQGAHIFPSISTSFTQEQQPHPKDLTVKMASLKTLLTAF